MNTTVVGNYPKICADKKAPNLRAALNSFDQKKVTAEELERVLQETIKRVIREQEQAGLDVVTDGQIRWEDLVTPLAKKIQGFEIGGLIRYFNNNVYYRRPIIKGTLRYDAPVLVEGFKFAQANSAKPVKVSLPAPFSFGQLCLDEHYNDTEKLTMTLAEILNQEIRNLEQAGCQRIQLDEPSLSYAPEQADLAVRGINQALQGVKAHKTLFFYFGRVDKILPKVLSANVDAVGIDVVSHKENLEAVSGANWDGKGLVLGCLDARNTKLEKEEEVRKMVEQAGKKVSPSAITLSPSCGLEFLPHESALAKLRRLVEIASKLN